MKNRKIMTTILCLACAGVLCTGCGGSKTAGGNTEPETENILQETDQLAGNTKPEDSENTQDNDAPEDATSTEDSEKPEDATNTEVTEQEKETEKEQPKEEPKQETPKKEEPKEEKPAHTHNWVAVTETIHHDAEYTTVHHEAEYKTVHHDAEYKTVHHDAVYEEQKVYVETIPVTKRSTWCKGCWADLDELSGGLTHDAFAEFATQHMLEHLEKEGVTYGWGTFDRQIGTKDLYDTRKVLVSEAYDEEVLVKEAYDEQVLVKEAYDEQVLVKDAWDETVTTGYKCECGATK